MRAEIDSSDPVNWDSSLNQGLVSWWKALPDQQRGNMFRDLCLRNHGTLTNGPTWSGLSHPGGWGSVNFDGSDDYVDCGTAGNFTSDFSVIVEVYVNAGVTTPVFVNKGPFAGDGWYVQDNGNQYRFVIGSVILTALSSTTRDAWITIGASLSGTTGTLYLNGESIGSRADFVAPASSSQNLFIGRYSTDGFNLNGRISSVRIYDRALPSSDFAASRAESLAGHPTTLNWQRRLTYFDTGAAPPGGLSIPIAMYHHKFHNHAA